MADCYVTIGKEFNLNFVASVDIPIGFGINPDYSKYQCYLTFDKDSVKYTKEEKLYPAVVTVPDPNNQGNVIETNCMTRMRVLTISGPLFYNSIISGFLPINNLNAPNSSAILTEPTAFSASSTIYVDQLIGYSCYECTMPDNILDGFEVLITKGNEFVITADGGVETYNPKTPEVFLKELQGKSEQTIHIPYTITLRPIVPVQP